MDIKKELIKACDEELADLCELMGVEPDEEDKMFFKLKKEELMKSTLGDIDKLSEKDEIFVSDNLSLYKQLFTAALAGDTTKLKVALLQLVKIKSEIK